MAIVAGNPGFLVVAHSARMLAQSAARGAHRVCALDLFNDVDTGRYALASEAVDARPGGGPGFDGTDLLRRADRLCPSPGCIGLIYGAGFEDDTGTLERLARGRTLLGNRPELVRRLKDPVEFFALLDRLAIAHPPTTVTAPGDRRGWLYKCAGATGGRHVVDAATLEREPPPGQGYYQRRCSGRSLSMLFLADGRRIDVIGISEQLTMRRGPHRYTYAGAIGPAPVPPSVPARLREAAAALVEATGLVGCNSIDLLLDGTRPLILEVNPRPSATMDLYDADWPSGLFDAHVRACRGELPAPRRALRTAAGPAVRGHAIVYADASMPVTAPAPSEFPPWCSDLPRTGTLLAPGTPVCTVHAAHADVARTRRLLSRRSLRIRMQLEQHANGEDNEDGSRTSQAERESAGRAAGRVAA